jgi:xylose isomerase
MKKSRAHFPNIPAIAYEGPKSDNALAFRHYNPDEIIDGKSLAEHLRFSIAYWHSFRGTGSDPFGPGTIVRPWESGKDPVSVAKVEWMPLSNSSKRSARPSTVFHDRDIAPEGRTLAESNRHLDAIVAHAYDLQQATGIKLLWGTCEFVLAIHGTWRAPRPIRMLTFSPTQRPK